MNIQRAEIEPEELEGFSSNEISEPGGMQEWKDQTFEEIILLLQKAERPLILVGGGVRTAGAQGELLNFVKNTGIPVVSSLMGLDAISHDNPTFFGLIGSYGNRYSNLALANCDLLFVLGSRLDTRQTGSRPDTFALAAKIIHVDIDKSELNAKVRADIALHGNVRHFLHRLNELAPDFATLDLSKWYDIIKGYRDRYPSSSPSIDSRFMDPNQFMQVLSKHCGPNQIICLDVGQHQMWANQSFQIKQGQRLLNAGGMGAMGFALPAAIGAAKANPGQQTIVIAGDGGIQVNIQELETIKNHKLPIKIFVMNNYNLGMVRQFQDVYFQGRQQSSLIGYSCPDLIKIAKAYGIRTYQIPNLDHAEEMIRKALAYKGPVLVHIPLDPHSVVQPKLVVNKPIEDMSPQLDRDVLQKEMLIDLIED